MKFFFALPPSGAYIACCAGNACSSCSPLTFLPLYCLVDLLRQGRSQCVFCRCVQPTPRTMSSDAANKMESFKSDSTVSAEFRPGKQDALEPSQLVRIFPARIFPDSVPSATSHGHVHADQVQQTGIPASIKCGYAPVPLQVPLPLSSAPSPTLPLASPVLCRLSGTHTH